MLFGLISSIKSKSKYIMSNWVEEIKTMDWSLYEYLKLWPRLVATKNVFENRIFPDYCHILYNFECKVGFLWFMTRYFKILYTKVKSNRNEAKWNCSTNYIE